MESVFDDIVYASQACKMEQYTKFVKAFNEEVVKAIKKGNKCVRILAQEDLQIIFKNPYEIMEALRKKGYTIKTNMTKSEVKKNWWVEIYWN